MKYIRLDCEMKYMRLLRFQGANEQRTVILLTGKDKCSKSHIKQQLLRLPNTTVYWVALIVVAWYVT